MNLPHYNIRSSSNFELFEFLSRGPNGTIIKQVVFKETSVSGIYNLGFGDKDPKTGTLSDTAVSNNRDRD